MGGTLSGAGASGLSDLIAIAFPITSGDNSIPQQANNDQPTVEALLKEQIKSSPGWQSAHSAGYQDLLPGVPMVPAIFLGMADQLWDLTGLGSIFQPSDLFSFLSGLPILGGVIPNLDATKITSGFFNADLLQPLIDAISGGLGGGTGFDFTDLFSFLDGGSFFGQIVEALTGTFGGTELLGPLTGLFAPFLDFLDGTGGSSGAGNFIDNGDGTGFFDPFGLGNFIDNGDGTGMTIAGLLENLMGQLGTFQATADRQQGIIDSIFNALNFTNITGNYHDDSLQSALQNIPFLNIIGVGGPSNIGGSVQGTWDNLISGLVGTVGSGAGLADLFNISQSVSSNAAKGGMSFNILGILTNKSMDSGFLSTSKSNMPLSRTAFQPTAPTIPVTQSVSTIGFERINQSAPIGMVSWRGHGNASMTDFRVNIWKMNPATGDMSLVHNSINILGSVAGSQVGGKEPWNIYSLPSPIASVASEVYGFELCVVGAGTHNVVGETANTLNHPTAFPKNYAATRNSGTGSPPSTIDSGSVTYSASVPTIEFGPDAGVGSDSHDVEVTQFSTSTTVPIPTWCNHLDVAVLGAGGGGHQGGSFGIGGEGGSPGAWSTVTWNRSTHFTTGTISIVVGAGGAAGVGGNGGNGGASSATISGSSVTGAGGAGADSLDLLGINHVGGSPGNIVFNGQPYVGGTTQNTYGAAGAAPGGGGGGGNWISFQPGGKGANGAVWIRAYQ